MAKNNTNPNAAQGTGEAEMESLLYHALLKGGWVIPHTPEEVALVTALMGGRDVELPPELLDSEAVLRGVMTPRSLPAPPPVNPETVEQLACAARNGGDIPPEVRQQMKQDRDAAEQDHGDERH